MARLCLEPTRCSARTFVPTRLAMDACAPDGHNIAPTVDSRASRHDFRLCSLLI